MIILYDARAVSAGNEALWDGPRREQYLIRTDVRVPLSVDTMVWPSVFDRDRCALSSPVERSGSLADGLPVPDDWCDWEWPLWTDPGRMSESLARPIPAQFVPYWRIAIGIYGTEREAAGGEMAMTFLGFDVADEGLLSGLANCGYDEGERPEIRATWSDALNEHHLFARREDAERFREAADRRVPEHRPFQVYALWRID